MVFEICEQTDRQTDRHADRNRNTSEFHNLFVARQQIKNNTKRQGICAEGGLLRSWCSANMRLMPTIKV